ncbi:hypothetical protein TEQG_02606 [Trichophyton equinum CBS 127.97]|uniref:Uncharacterized protein n=1 Tax=Trichophyton equinum (strain ATCC MYA-4606 / CBS 127.97) TaxID=559882 RepID=F2PNV8_TRIEC|nr:hypothetical protein TEQG_02606 [Trichophyton equinum CBS 127.97]
MAPSEKTAKPTSELSGSPALTHLTSNSSGSDSKPQIMSKEERHQVFQQHLKKNRLHDLGGVGGVPEESWALGRGFEHTIRH